MRELGRGEGEAEGVDKRVRVKGVVLSQLDAV